MRLNEKLRLGFKAILISIIFSLSFACGGDEKGGNGGASSTYSISGQVTTNGTGLSGVTVTLSGTSSGTVTTDNNGNYSYSGLSNGSYTVTVSSTNSKILFSPISKDVTVSGTNRSGVDFTASEKEEWGEIGSDGGTVEVTDSTSQIYGVSVIVPEDTVSDGTIIAIDIEDNPPPESLPEGIVQLGPGLRFESTSETFNDSVFITIPFSEGSTQEDEMRLVFYYDDSKAEWQAVAPLPTPEPDKFIAQVEHFSSYVKGKATVSSDSKITGFSLKYDTHAYRNDAKVACLYDTDKAGICAGMAALAAEYFNYWAKKEGEGLRCRWGKVKDSNASCDAHGNWLGENVTTSEKYNKKTNDFIRLLNMAAEKVKSSYILSYIKFNANLNRVVPLHLSDGIGNNHAVVATGWEKTGIGTGNIKIYDVNYNNESKFRNIQYSTIEVYPFKYIRFTYKDWKYFWPVSNVGLALDEIIEKPEYESENLCDSYEVDDTYTEANTIQTDGTAQRHNIGPAGDVDWVKFSATSGKPYDIKTLNLSGGCDTYISLYSTDGITLIDNDNDSGGETFASRIEWTCGNSGTYYVKIGDSDLYYGTGGYDISINDNHDPQLSSGDVDPNSGDTSTTFTYTVKYYDQDGDSPSTKYVYIDGSSHTMSRISGSNSNGTYRYQTTLSTGSHNYYFSFTDGQGGSDRLPSSGTYSGPTVSGGDNFESVRINAYGVGDDCIIEISLDGSKLGNIDTRDSLIPWSPYGGGGPYFYQTQYFNRDLSLGSHSITIKYLEFKGDRDPLWVYVTAWVIELDNGWPHLPINTIELKVGESHTATFNIN